MGLKSWQSPALVRSMLAVASITSLVLWTVFVVFWVRSYFRRDVAHWHFNHGSTVCKVVSDRGDLTFVMFPSWSTDFKTAWGFNRADDPERDPPNYDMHAYDTTLGFALRRASIPSGHRNMLFLAVPHWFVVTTLLVFTLKKKPRSQFSLLDLIVLTTCLALVLGCLSAMK